MARKQKLAHAAVSTPTEEPGSATKRALEAAARVIGAGIEAIESGETPIPQRDRPLAAVKLAAQLVAIGCEARKAEKAELRALGELTREQVLAWARAQTAETRARLRRDLEALDSRRSVLA